MTNQGLFPCLLLLLVACSVPEAEPESKAPEPFQHSFDGSSTMDGLLLASGEWKIVEDSTAPVGGHALAQLSKGVSKQFNVMLFEGTERSDVDVSVALRSIAGEIDQGGGLVWRAKDADNYYVARYNPLEDNYRVYTVLEGKRTKLKSKTIPHSEGWHRLRVTMTGNLIRCYYEDELALELEDTTFADPGQLGLWTKADAQTHFDDLK